MMRVPFSSPNGVSNSGEMSTISSTPNSLAKKTAISTVAGLSHSAIRKRIGVSRSTCFMICAVSANWRIAVAVSRSSVAKFTVSRGQFLIISTMRASAWRSRQVARPRLVHVGAEGVVELQRVDAQMDVRGAEARRIDEAGERGQRPLHLRRIDRIDQLRQNSESAARRT